MRVLVTRPAEDGAAFGKALSERGVDHLLAPMMAVRFMDDVALDLRGVQAVLVTSANGARALARLTPRRDLELMAVGPATAEAARQAGFASVETAGGDVERLAERAAATYRPADGRLLHIAGSVVAGDLHGLLSDAGLTVDRVVAYGAEAARRLPEPVAGALSSGTLDGVVFFSARTAKLFVKLALEAGLSDRLSGLAAFCLSRAVSEALPPALFGRILIAERPEGGGLVDLISSVATD
jgi:uroporphyrinogen-III synthase